MKISEALKQKPRGSGFRVSFEFYPPKTHQGLLNLYERIERMSNLGPIFIDITWGAGGTTSDLTTQFVKVAHEEFGLETCMHLTCTNMEAGKVDVALDHAQKYGCHNILALRGDPPRGQEEWTATEGGFEHAVDLVRHIRKNYGKSFDIAVAGFPEGHPQALERKEEMEHLKAKIDAGANFIFTQMFYDLDTFVQWVKDVRAAGIEAPIVPGIMPIQGYASFQKTTSFSKTIVPQHFYDALEPVKDDDQKVREVGTRLVRDMCRAILDNEELGINLIHIYTMNLEKGTRMLLDALDYEPQVDIVNPLPWRPSLTPLRRDETTRPIFWANRAKSYIRRTESWDEFPNGRWGDSRSPAFGELDGYGVNLKHDKEEALAMWGSPTSFTDIAALFARFCRGEVAALPWSDQPAAKETNIIAEQLAQVNEMGFLTINSQPPVDGAPSSHPIHGWGPKNGYVYQKAYLEFFTSPELFKRLLEAFGEDEQITWFAVDKSGHLETNTTSEGPNAVTWGCFPEKEILQPTIVEKVSFLAWKDEAFELGLRWASVYDEASTSRALLNSIFDSFLLVNVVRNDFRNTDADALFRPFVVAAERAARSPMSGDANWHGSMTPNGIHRSPSHSRNGSV